MESKNVAYNEKIDHLRFFAAFFVLLYHTYHVFGNKYGIADTWNEYSDPIRGLVTHGNSAVGLFITLSGFIFTLIAFNKKIDAGQFIRNRCLRIFPLYSIALLLVAYAKPFAFSALIGSLLFMHNLSIGLKEDISTLHMWTIAVEFQLYLLFPFIIVLFRKYGFKALMGIIFLSILIRTFLYFRTGDIYSLSYYTIFGRLDQFLIGCMAARCYQLVDRKISGWWFIASLIGGLIFITVLRTQGEKFSATSPFWIYWFTIESLMAALVIFSYCKSSFELPRKLSIALAFLGTISYSLYITHWFIIGSGFIPKIYWFNDAFMNCMGIAFFIVFPITLFISMGTYFIIEKPFIDYRKQYTK